MDDEDSVGKEGNDKTSWFKSLKRSNLHKKLNYAVPGAGLGTVGGMVGRFNKSELDMSRRTGALSPACGADCVTGDLAGLRVTELQSASQLSAAEHYYTIDSRNLASRHKLSAQDKNLQQAAKQFNLDPDKGLKILEDKGFIKLEPLSIAQFLLSHGRLSKKQIGIYLGGREDFNQDVLKAFVSLHVFTNLLLVQALRQFLWSFRLPGEAQQIDRIMSAFAGEYSAQNRDLVTRNTDTVYILSFSIIMLNTSLHNKNVKDKLTEEQFVNQNQGIDAGADLPREMLKAIYLSIKEEPFLIPDENYEDLTYTFFCPDMEGWLIKQGGTWKTWKRRWFVLNDSCLYYFQSTAENNPLGIIPLENVDVREVAGDGERPWQFEIFSCSPDSRLVKGCKKSKSGSLVRGNHKVYRMAVGGRQERDDWVCGLKKALRSYRVREIITEKKDALMDTSRM